MAITIRRLTSGLKPHLPLILARPWFQPQGPCLAYRADGASVPVPDFQLLRCLVPSSSFAQHAHSLVLVVQNRPIVPRRNTRVHSFTRCCFVRSLHTRLSLCASTASNTRSHNTKDSYRACADKSLSQDLCTKPAFHPFKQQSQKHLYYTSR